MVRTYSIVDAEGYFRMSHHAEFTRLELDLVLNRFRFIDDGFYGSNSPYFPLTQHTFDGALCLQVQGVFDPFWAGGYVIGGRSSLYCLNEDRLDLLFGSGLPGHYMGGYRFQEAPVTAGEPQKPDSFYAGVWKYSNDELCGADCRIEIDVVTSQMTVRNSSLHVPLIYPIEISRTGTPERGSTVLYYTNARGDRHFWRALNETQLIDDRGEMLVRP